MNSSCCSQNQTQFEVHFEKFQSGLSVKNENLKSLIVLLRIIPESKQSNGPWGK